MVSKFYQKIRSLMPSGSQIWKVASACRHPVLVTNLLAASLVVGIQHLGMLEKSELVAFDYMTRWRPDEGPDPRLLVVGVTENDIKTQKEWPLSDSTIATALQKLERLKPRAIGLDIYRDIPIGNGNAQLLKTLSQNDRIIVTCKTQDDKTPGVAPPPGVPSKRVGFADVMPDSDGIIHRGFLFLTPSAPPVGSPQKPANICQDPNTTLSSLNFQLALLYFQAQGISPELTSTNELKIGSTLFRKLNKNSGIYRNADLGGYQLQIRYRSPNNPAKQVTLTEVLSGKVDPSLVKDRIVLIGYTAESTKDYFLTPYSNGQRHSAIMPGVVIHAQILSQILSAVLNNQPLFWFWPQWVEAIWLGSWCLVGGTIAARIRHPLRFVLAGVVALGSLVVVSFAIFTQGGWVPLAAPLLGLILTAGSVILVDRCNQAGYRAISDNVKAIFKIEIDQEKREREVTEIVESEYFQQLQSQAELIRKNNINTKENNGSMKTNTKEDNSLEDYFGQLQQKALHLKNTEDAGDKSE